MGAIIIAKNGLSTDLLAKYALRVFHHLPCSGDCPKFLLTLMRFDVGGYNVFVEGGLAFVMLGWGSRIMLCEKLGLC